ncbi:unnamed protein product [Cylicocyclus nassatus]|uniref:Uncharacterized protein n=1 Tax=Cylicocyclus nassatus TaxID=53992 RepID=A0AA36HBD3_CYLNA|nr:unnamed protein product [Cylicocyclus nassatus]
MQAALLVILIGVWIVSAVYDPVFVDELRSLVKHKSDRNLLKALRDNGHLNRTTKEEILKVILKIQNEETKGAYATAVERTKQRRKAQYDKVLSKAGANQAVKDFLEQAEKIENDMTITDDDARKKVNKLKRKLTRKQRKLVERLQ